ncbi:dipeptide epimerase [Prochlorothrix hollandica]|uniref:Dipeptide epimerase n=1 Tax=Prochlorothrix hollandica PCC 9006 = CALU 1027 TaxID=317619 RepID=A0A0M2Q2K7_PROHO|nr:dipeptide epimerase [Prochlorothrix hollandica]KKJ01498.1 mandelate racemase [Prochlorothrix hollandica PCC 9006 = CALU 1027]
MELTLQSFTVHKRFALTISRGTTDRSTNLWLRLRHDGIEGWGEASPFSIGHSAAHPDQTTDLLQAAFTALVPHLSAYNPWQRQCLDSLLGDLAPALPSGIRTALDLALWDWWGKCLGRPLWQLWGLTPTPLPPTSVTIGLGTPAAAQERLLAWRSITPSPWIKVKLGSPQGAETDRALFSAVQAVADPTAQFLVDANGGWDLETAIAMGQWLADRGVVYLEQPLPKGAEDQLPTLMRDCPLPIFVDESCWTLGDVLKVGALGIRGINIKLLKTGGLTEAWRMIHLAQALGLQIMLGCYSDSSLLNTAAAQLAPLAQYLDLDSHLNLKDDPFEGVTLDETGSMVLPDRPGLGVRLKAE